MKILIVEDEPLIAKALERVLSQDHQVMAVATSESQALSLLRSMKPDVVITDHDLKPGSGIKVMRAAKKAGVETVFGMSGSWDGVREMRDLLGFFDRVFDKPLNMMDVLKALR